jgi:tRNA A37 methylthiotransferase MiaB
VKVFLEARCTLNQGEGRIIADLLRSGGHEIVATPEAAAPEGPHHEEGEAGTTVARGPNYKQVVLLGELRLGLFLEAEVTRATSAYLFGRPVEIGAS